MTWTHLLDLPAYPAAGFARLADRIGALLKTRNDIVLVMGEAIVALEAAAASVARPGLRVVNVVTSPYGRWFGQWLRRGGATVADVTTQPGLPVTAEAVGAALDAQPGTQLVALVHAESASGILNPLPEIVALARSHGALTVVDAVASFGGHSLDVDGLGIDIAVIGPQKALGGSAGLSALSVSPAAWALIERPGALVLSALSLLDLKHNWVDTGRGALPGMPSALEFHALEAALDRVDAEGIDALVARHTRAGEASRDGLSALGLHLWVPGAQASNLVTAARLPDGIPPDALLAAAARFDAGLARGLGEAGDRFIRLNHTGPRARFDIVLANLVAFGQALRSLGHAADVGAAAVAVAEKYAASG